MILRKFLFFERFLSLAILIKRILIQKHCTCFTFLVVRCKRIPNLSGFLDFLNYVRKFLDRKQFNTLSAKPTKWSNRFWLAWRRKLSSFVAAVSWKMQSQPPEVLYQISVLKIFAKSTGNTCVAVNVWIKL